MGIIYYGISCLFKGTTNIPLFTADKLLKNHFRAVILQTMNEIIKT